MASNLMYRHGMKNHFGSFWCSFMYPRMQKKERRLSVQKLRIDREWFVSNFIDFLKQVNLPLSAIVSENQSLILILFPLNFYNQISIRDGHSTILNHFYVSQKLQMKEYVDFDLLFFIWIYNSHRDATSKVGHVITIRFSWGIQISLCMIVEKSFGTISIIFQVC